MVIAIEVRAIRRHVVEHTIENQPDTQLLCVLRQVVPVFLLAEIRIDMQIVLRVVTVVRSGVEDGVHVDRVYSERLEITKLLVDALQVAAKVVTSTRPFPVRSARLRSAEAPGARTVRLRIGAAVALWKGVPRKREDRVVVARIAGMRIVIVSTVAEAI